MAEPAGKPDIARTIEALLCTPLAGREVARALSEQAEERNRRKMIAEMRARRAQHMDDRAFETVERRYMGVEAVLASFPWSQSH